MYKWLYILFYIETLLLLQITDLQIVLNQFLSLIPDSPLWDDSQPVLQSQSGIIQTFITIALLRQRKGLEIITWLSSRSFQAVHMKWKQVKICNKVISTADSPSSRFLVYFDSVSEATKHMSNSLKLNQGFHITLQSQRVKVSIVRKA